MSNKKEEAEIPLTEDLMREHGLLNRVLLVYEEIIRRIDADENFSLSTLNNAVSIIKSFIEDYHEKLEEDYLFPLFEKHRKEILQARLLMVEGKLQIEGEVIHVIVSRCFNLSNFLRGLTAAENDNLPVLKLSRADERTSTPDPREAFHKGRNFR